MKQSKPIEQMHFNSIVGCKMHFRRCNKYRFLIISVLIIVITLSICMLLWPSCDPISNGSEFASQISNETEETELVSQSQISNESEFLFRQYAISDWYPTGLKGDNETGYPGDPLCSTRRSSLPFN